MNLHLAALWVVKLRKLSKSGTSSRQVNSPGKIPQALAKLLSCPEEVAALSLPVSFQVTNPGRPDGPAPHGGQFSFSPDDNCPFVVRAQEFLHSHQ
jgi:hypothetical protein